MEYAADNTGWCTTLNFGGRLHIIRETIFLKNSAVCRTKRQVAGHQWSTKYYCDVAKGVVVMCHVSSRHSLRVHSATCDSSVCHVAGVRDVRPLLQVLRGADGVPAVLQGPGQGQPGLQGVLGGEWR